MHWTVLLSSALAPIFGLTLAAPPRHPPPLPATTTHINSAILTTPSTTEWTYNGTALDGPKTHPVNGTNFDWWYFDALSSDLPSGDLSSVVVNFYTTSSVGFFGKTQNDSVLVTTITGTFRDGTPFGIDVFPDEATISTEGDRSSGQWGTAATCWTSSPDRRD
ncbi:hypothetical protein B0A55_01333 [Friedmanniomyces simplex]|uniref:Diels-Alderase N-terminal domain-containing protein n=1 Tax=Friedmanniomyces simplex TaxID=329884 RepID=A0A4U0Y034_9PEZI|nr:hypothetical protein B0A55_01333 [Friedmanniomyces simplex]